MRIRLVLASLAIAAPAAAETYHVAPGGSDDATGLDGAPWATLQRAADAVAPGDTVIVAAGEYQGFYLETSGEDGAPITFRADGEARITSDNPTTPDGINLEGASFVRIEGFTVVGATRAGIRAVLCERVELVGNVADANGRWGILTGFCDDLLIEGNECSRSGDEHGIYVSNSGDRPVVRGNVLWGNNANGLHMNGDMFAGGDGVISEALVEGNVILDNGVAGGSGINGDGVVDSVIRNNLLYGNHASGISLYRIDGGAPSTSNLVINNTVVMAEDGRWALNIQDLSTSNTARNNILFHPSPERGSIDLCAGCEAGFVSDSNVVVDRFTHGDAFLDLAGWRADTGQDAASLTASLDELFVDAAADDYALAAGSPAVDVADPDGAPDVDVAGNSRPQGAGYDIGALEQCDGDPCFDAPGPGDPGGGGGGGGGDDDGGGCCRGSPAGASSILLALLVFGVSRRRRSGAREVP
jgi:parallel beta-helix repeat protein